MSEDDLERRVTDLEPVEELRSRADETGSDASAARVLAAGADHDVSGVRAELRTRTRALSALRQTQLEQGQRLDRLEDEVDRGFAQVGASVARVEQDLATVRAGVQQTVDLLTDHED